MGRFAIAILVLALAGAAGSWIVGAIYYARTLAAIEGQDRGRLWWLAVIGWPFVIGRLKGTASQHAAIVNKAIIAFFICVTLAVATISLSTNYNRLSG